ncbi:MAG: hypothetical protein EOP49_47140 [Sphingobacteriales bacterium]|nr:MAG: hypothetical protein EOP49_47140 [Sphingobacteriales bacterium]
MEDEFVGEIKMFAFDFVPAGFSRCEGQLLAIAPNSALFSILGVTYGGNGQVTFALPDLRNRLVMGVGQNHQQGELGGVENVVLITSGLPTHTHAIHT